MKILHSKVQYAPIVRTIGSEERTSFVKLGVCMEFDDGTTARWSIRHCTWSVMPPKHYEHCRIVRGLTHMAFCREYSSVFVRMCVQCRMTMGY